jgi:hypothetical protein
MITLPNVLWLQREAPHAWRRKMTMDFDPVLLSRVQFAFVVSFHIIFPSFTIGLAA